MQKLTLAALFFAFTLSSLTAQVATTDSTAGTPGKWALQVPLSGDISVIRMLSPRSALRFDVDSWGRIQLDENDQENHQDYSFGIYYLHLSMHYKKGNLYLGGGPSVSTSLTHYESIGEYSKHTHIYRYFTGRAGMTGIIGFNHRIASHVWLFAEHNVTIYYRYSASEDADYDENNEIIERDYGWGGWYGWDLNTSKAGLIWQLK